MRDEQVPDEEIPITAAALARRLDIKVRAIVAMVIAGQWPSHRIAGQIMFTTDDIQTIQASITGGAGSGGPV